MKTANRSGGNTIAAIVVAVCLLMAAVTQSRAWICGYSIALIIAVAAHPAVRLHKWQLCVAALILIVLPIGLAIGWKQDSSKGRLLIYKISTIMLRDHFPEGLGWGKFKETYNYYQSDYFEKGQYTEKEMLLADNTWFAFNDYYQYLIEGGWMAILLIPPCITAMIFLSIRALKRRNGLLSVSAAAQLAAIFTAACFTHVFEKPLTQAVALCAVVILAGLRWRACLSAVLLVCLTHYGFYLFHYDSYQKLSATKKLLSSGSRAQPLDDLAQLYPVLRRDAGFLKLYGTHLLEMNQPLAAIAPLEAACRLQPQYSWLLRLGEAYEVAGRLTDAEATYLRAVYMVPNRFVSKMKLFNFYQRQQRQEDAIRWGKKILTQPVKIPSGQVNIIREYISQRMLQQR